MQFSTMPMGIESLAKNKLIHALKSLPAITPPSQKFGCGLAYLANKVEEHYSNEHKRHNRLPVRLIGAQAIALARFGYRLADCLQYEGETDGQRLCRIALSKSIQFLRNAGGLFNKIHIVNFPCGRKPEYPEETHDFRQSVDFYSFHMRTGFESH